MLRSPVILPRPTLAEPLRVPRISLPRCAIEPPCFSICPAPVRRGVELRKCRPLLADNSPPPAHNGISPKPEAQMTTPRSPVLSIPPPAPLVPSPSVPSPLVPSRVRLLFSQETASPPPPNPRFLGRRISFKWHRINNMRGAYQVLISKQNPLKNRGFCSTKASFGPLFRREMSFAARRFFKSAAPAHCLGARF